MAYNAEEGKKMLNVIKEIKNGDTNKGGSRNTLCGVDYSDGGGWGKGKWEGWIGDPYLIKLFLIIMFNIYVLYNYNYY